VKCDTHNYIEKEFQKICLHHITLFLCFEHESKKILRNIVKYVSNYMASYYIKLQIFIACYMGISFRCVTYIRDK
jgi:hypothetical protein